MPKAAAASARTAAEAPPERLALVFEGNPKTAQPSEFIATLFRFADNTVAYVPRTILPISGELRYDIDTAVYANPLTRRIVHGKKGAPNRIAKQHTRRVMTAVDRDRKQLLDQAARRIDPNIPSSRSARPALKGLKLVA